MSTALSDDHFHLDQDLESTGSNRPTGMAMDERESSFCAIRGRRKTFWARFWIKNEGLAWVLLSQFFASLMSVTARLLEAAEQGLHPFQVLMMGMAIALALSSAYMWYARVPSFPLGVKEVRGLLMLRGFGGFIGIFGLYYSLLYLPIAEATVLRFLAPLVSCWACSILLSQPFTRTEQLAGLVSLCGVALLARPTSLFPSSEPVAVHAAASDVLSISERSSSNPEPVRVTPTQRLSAVGAAMLGVLGAACAYTCIRWIGKRAHPLISVNYIAGWCTFASTACLIAFPDVHFKMLASLRQWAYVLVLGFSSFMMQFLLTSGLQYEKSSRATNMIYSQMLFALAFDRIVWGTTPGLLSILGSTLILASAIYITLQKEGQQSSATVTAPIATTDIVPISDENARLAGHYFGRRPSLQDEEMGLISERIDDNELGRDEDQDPDPDGVLTIFHHGGNTNGSARQPDSNSEHDSSSSPVTKALSYNQDSELRTL